MNYNNNNTLTPNYIYNQQHMNNNLNTNYCNFNNNIVSNTNNNFKLNYHSFIDKI